MAATFTDFDFDMSGHNRYIDNISPKLGDFFRFFSYFFLKRHSFAKIVSERLDIQNIDDIS